MGMSGIVMYLVDGLHVRTAPAAVILITRHRTCEHHEARVPLHSPTYHTQKTCSVTGIVPKHLSQRSLILLYSIASLRVVWPRWYKDSNQSTKSLIRVSHSHPWFIIMIQHNLLDLRVSIHWSTINSHSCARVLAVGSTFSFTWRSLPHILGNIFRIQGKTSPNKEEEGTSKTSSVLRMIHERGIFLQLSVYATYTTHRPSKVEYFFIMRSNSFLNNARKLRTSPTPWSIPPERWGSAYSGYIG